MVAPLRGIPSEVSHLAAPRNGIVPETASPPSHGPPAGQGRASGPGETSEAARPAEPLRRRTIMRDRSSFKLTCRPLQVLHSSSWMREARSNTSRQQIPFEHDGALHCCALFFVVSAHGRSLHRTEGGWPLRLPRARLSDEREAVALQERRKAWSQRRTFVRAVRARGSHSSFAHS
jgi:hypothetical protein